MVYKTPDKICPYRKPTVWLKKFQSESENIENNAQIALNVDSDL